MQYRIVYVPKLKVTNKNLNPFTTNLTIKNKFWASHTLDCHSLHKRLNSQKLGIVHYCDHFSVCSRFRQDWFPLLNPKLPRLVWQAEEQGGDLIPAHGAIRLRSHGASKAEERGGGTPHNSNPVLDRCHGTIHARYHKTMVRGGEEANDSPVHGTIWTKKGKNTPYDWSFLQW